MDVSTVLGFVIGLGLIFWSMAHGGGAGNLALFVHIPALTVVLGGSVSAIFVHFPIDDSKQMATIFWRSFVYRVLPPTDQIERIVSYANLARKEGLLALESK